MRILFLSYFFEPDLSAGSFKNTSLFKELLNNINPDDKVDVYTTEPNRYNSFKDDNCKYLNSYNFSVNRIQVPPHNNGFIGQVKSFLIYYKSTLRSISGKKYDLVYGSSSKLFTAFLAKRVSNKLDIPLYLDIRDIFADTVKDVFKGKFLIKYPLFIFAKFVEIYTFRKANHINLVSGGFSDYFKRYPKPTYSYFTNGIDDEFLISDFESVKYNSLKIITYAGNIGSGQGLEKIIPKAAIMLGNQYHFRIIGDGGTRKLLEQEIIKNRLTNVEIIKPVNRKDLLEYYRSTTFLFLHLNDLEAFKKVLPSKVFEYGATNKPIIAGVTGYASEFIRENLDNYILFNPTDVDSFVSQINSYPIAFIERTDFKEKFSRNKIMNEMAKSIIRLANKK